MKLFGKELKFNGYDVYHKGNKPTATDVGTYTSEEIDAKITESNGTRITVSVQEPAVHLNGQVWIQI